MAGWVYCSVSEYTWDGLGRALVPFNRSKGTHYILKPRNPETFFPTVQPKVFYIWNWHFLLNLAITWPYLKWIKKGYIDLCNINDFVLHFINLFIFWFISWNIQTPRVDVFCLSMIIQPPWVPLRDLTFENMKLWKSIDTCFLMITRSDPS